MQNYYLELKKSSETEDSKNWQVLLANRSVEDVKAFQEKALPWYQW